MSSNGAHVPPRSQPTTIAVSHEVRRDPARMAPQVRQSYQSPAEVFVKLLFVIAFLTIIHERKSFRIRRRSFSARQNMQKSVEQLFDSSFRHNFETNVPVFEYKVPRGKILTEEQRLNKSLDKTLRSSADYEKVRNNHGLRAQHSLTLNETKSNHANKLKSESPHGARALDALNRLADFKRETVPQDSTSSGRIAVCITGHARSFYVRSVHESILKNLIQSISNSSRNVDVFFHVGLNDVPRANTKEASNQTKKTLEAIGLLRPVLVSFFDNSIIQSPPPDLGQCPEGSELASTTYPSALLRAAECMQKVEAYEKSNEFHYDWVVKTRPDIAFGNPVMPVSGLPRDRVFINDHVPGASTPMFPVIRELFPDSARTYLREPLGDHIAFVPRQLAGIFFSAHKASHLCLTSTHKQLGKVNPEALLGIWMVMNWMRYETRPWFWILVRDHGGPECKRVKWIGRRAKMTKTLEERCRKYEQTWRNASDV